MKDHADVAAEIEHLRLGEFVDVFAEEKDTSGIGRHEAVGELEQNAFSAAGRAEDDDHFSGAGLEADVEQDRVAVEADGNVLKGDDRRVGIADGRLSGGNGFRGRHRLVPEAEWPQLPGAKARDVFDLERHG